MTPRMLGCLAGVLLAISSAQVTAQPLAEVARLEKARRAGLAARATTDDEPPKVYTIADLNTAGARLTTGSGPTPSSEDPEEPSTATDSADGATDDADAGATDADAEATDETGGPADEAAWRERVSTLRQAQARAELLADALQNRVDALWVDFTSRDDPAQRAVLDQNRQVAVQELAETQSQIEALSQEMDDLRREARRERVPAGWLR